MKISSFLASFLRQVAKSSDNNSPEYEAAEILLAGSLTRTSGEQREEVAQRCEKGDFSSVEITDDTLRDELKIVAQALRAFQNDPAKKAFAKKRHHKG